MLDTNVLVYFLFKGYESKSSDEVLAKTQFWCAPSLVYHEFESVVVRHFRHKLISRADAFEMHADFSLLVENRIIDPAPESVLRTAFASNLSAYDAQFVALATEIEGRLITNDKKIVAAFPEVALIPADYLASGIS